MATVQEAVRRLTIVSSDRGLSETERKLRGVQSGLGGVTVASKGTERATLSLERRVESIQRQYDRNYRSTQALAKVQRDLALAEAQGVVTLQRKNEILRLAEANTKRATAATTQYAGAISGMVAAFAGFALLAGLRSSVDASIRVTNALKVAGLEGEKLTAVYDRLYASAQRNSAPIEALVQLYGRASLVQRELNVSNDEMLRFTDRIALALRVSGRSAQESSGALLQLSQALGSGIVRAEEFNSILEGALPIAQAAAAGLEEAGGSVARLRALVIEGKVSSEAFFRAFEAGSGILEQKVAGAESTVSQGFVRLQNVLIDSVGKLNEATGVSRALGVALEELSWMIEDFGDAIERNQPGILKFFSSIGAGLDWLQGRAKEVREALGIEDFFEGTSLIEGRIGFKSQQLQPGMTEADFRDTFKMIERSREVTDLANALAEKVAQQNPIKPVSLEDYTVQTNDAAKATEEAEKKISGVIDQLKFETEQLGRSSREQAIWNQLKAAGVTLASAEGQQIAALAGRLFDLEAAQKAATDAQKEAERTTKALADARAKLAKDIAFERGTMFLSEEDARIAQQLRSIYGEDIPAALGSAEAEALRLNNRLREVAEVGNAMRESLAGAIADVFTGGAKTAGEFVDSLTKGIAKAAADLVASRLTDKLFGGALAPVDAAGSRVATALTGAAGKVQAATPPLASAATSLSGAAGNLKQAATALSAAGGGIGGGGFVPGAGLSSGIGMGGSALSAAKFNVQAAAAAIKAIESLGSGGYGALGKVIANGDRAYGAYQVMGNNIAEWTKAALGYSMTNQQFLASAEAQDKVFQHRFGLLVEKFGNVSDAASAWFTGQPLSVGGNRADINGMTGNAYVDKFNRLYTNGAPTVAPPANDNTLASVNIASVGGKAVSDATEIGGLSATSGVGGALTKLGGVLSSPTFQQGLAGFSMGFQSQSPVMGGLSGAFSGLMAGGPVGALVGGAAGIIGGLFGKSRAEREAEEKAREAWEAMAAEVAAFSDELRGKVTGDLGGAIASAEARFQKYRRAAKEAGESTDGLAKDLAAYTKRITKEFKRTFDLQVEAYTSGLGADDPALKAAESMRALRDELLGFVADAKLAGGGRGREAKRAAKGFVLSEIVGGATGPETAYEQYLAEEARIMGTRKEAVALLVELGVKEKKARKQVNAAIEEALADAQKIYQEAVNERRMGFADRVFAATTDLTTLEGQLAQFDRQAQRERERELADGGEAMADLERALAAERLKIQKDYQEQAIESARRAAEEMNQTARSIVEYVNDLKAGTDSPLSPVDRFTNAEAAYQAQIALAQGGDAAALGSITQFSDAYLKAAREMFASSADFFAIFDQVTSQLLALPAVQGATAPDVVAMLQVLDAVLDTNSAITTMMTTLEGAIAANSPTAIATALGPLFDTIDVDASGGITLAEMQTALGTTNAHLQSIFATLDADGDGQISRLEQISAATGPLASWLATVNATTGAVNAGVAGVNSGIGDVNANVGKNDESGLKRWTKNSALATRDLGKGVVPWMRVFAGRLYEISLFSSQAKGAKGKPRKGDDRTVFSAGKKGGISSGSFDPAGSWAQGGIVGRYANGGVIGNGLWNVDSVLARYAGGGSVALAGGEGVINARAMEMIGPSKFDLLNRGVIPGNDNGPHFRMLAISFTGDIATQNRVLMAGFRAMVETMERLEMRLARLEAATNGTTRAVRDKPVPKPQTKVA